MISIIVTTYKRPALLQRAVSSVLRQRFDGHECIELIVSDDDSDGSALVVLASMLPLPSHVSVKFLKRGQSGRGVAASRNRALVAAQGEWIAFLDDDDEWVDTSFGEMLSMAMRAGVDFCAGRYTHVIDNSEGIRVSESSPVMEWHGYDQLLIGNVFPIGSFIIRQSAIRIPFNTNLRTHEDWLFLLDNLPGIKIATAPFTVLDIHQSLDQSREQRNNSGGNLQKATDYVRIYSLHPAEHLFDQRCKVLNALGGVDIKGLIT